jgi:hypothetical protein
VRGLDKFGAKDGVEAAAEMQSQLQGDEGKFDPLLGSWIRINAYMAESLQRQGRGAQLLALRCPCCILVEDGQPELVARWIDGCTDDAHRHAVATGLLRNDG